MAITETQIRHIVNDNPLGTGTDKLDTLQYTTILTYESNIYRASALAARMIAAVYALKVSTAVSSVRVELNQKFKHYMKLSETLDFRASGGGGGAGVISAPELAGISITEMETQRENTDLVQPSFERGMHDNPPFSNSGENELLRSD